MPPNCADIMSEQRAIITITGDLGSGKSTVAKIIAKQQGLQRFSTGNFQRQLAREQGLTSLELNKLSEQHPEVDAQIDACVINLVKEQTNLIIDSRLAWHFAPDSFKVYLTVDPMVAASRILHSQREKEERYSSLEEAFRQLAERRASEELRFQTLYQVALTDVNNYDLIVDTTHAAPEVITARIVEQYRLWRESQLEIKAWFSPRRLFPTKDLSPYGDNAAMSAGGDIRPPVRILMVADYYYIYEGHRRVAAAISAGLPFCPCFIQATNDECVCGALSARAYVQQQVTRERIHGWEAVNGFTFPSYPSLI